MFKGLGERQDSRVSNHIIATVCKFCETILRVGKVQLAGTGYKGLSCHDITFNCRLKGMKWE